MQKLIIATLPVVTLRGEYKLELITTEYARTIVEVYNMFAGLRGEGCGVLSAIRDDRLEYMFARLIGQEAWTTPIKKTDDTFQEVDQQCLILSLHPYEVDNYPQNLLEYNDYQFLLRTRAA